MISTEDVFYAVSRAAAPEVEDKTITISVASDDASTFDAVCAELWKLGAEVVSYDPYAFMSIPEFDRFVRDIAFDGEDIDTVFVFDMRRGRSEDPDFMAGVDENLLSVREECAGLPIHFVIIE